MLEKLQHKDEEEQEDPVLSIIEAMEFLKAEAEKSGNENIHCIISSAFNLCVHSYTLKKHSNDLYKNTTQH